MADGVMSWLRMTTCLDYKIVISFPTTLLECERPILPVSLRGMRVAFSKN